MKRSFFDLELFLDENQVEIALNFDSLMKLIFFQESRENVENRRNEKNEFFSFIILPAVSIDFNQQTFPHRTMQNTDKLFFLSEISSIRIRVFSSS